MSGTERDYAPPWFQFADRAFDMDPILMGTSYGFYVRLLSWSNEHLKDGVVPLKVLEAIVGGEPLDLHLERMVSSGAVRVDGDSLVLVRFLTHCKLASYWKQFHKRQVQNGAKGADATRGKQAKNKRIDPVGLPVGEPVAEQIEIREEEKEHKPQIPPTPRGAESASGAGIGDEGTEVAGDHESGIFRTAAPVAPPVSEPRLVHARRETFGLTRFQRTPLVAAFEDGINAERKAKQRWRFPPAEWRNLDDLVDVLFDGNVDRAEGELRALSKRYCADVGESQTYEPGRDFGPRGLLAWHNRGQKPATKPMLARGRAPVQPTAPINMARTSDDHEENNIRILAGLRKMSVDEFRPIYLAEMAAFEREVG